MTTMAEKMAERDSRWAKVKEMPHFVTGLGFTVHMATEYLELGNRRTASILTDMVKARILTAHTPVGGREMVYTRAPASEMCRRWVNRDNGIPLGRYYPMGNFA